ncbi:MAG: JAB domain-containing protein [Planctomycetota bacterium]
MFKTRAVHRGRVDGDTVNTEHVLTVKTVTVSYDARAKLRPCVDGPEIARRVCVQEFSKRDTDAEHVFLLCLTATHRLLAFKQLHTGTGTQSAVDIRKAFRVVLKHGAAGFILAHNHPSGILRPSPEDIKLTRRLAAGAAVLGLNFCDHIIVTPDGRTLSLYACRPDVFKVSIEI